jgi:hypothetical protein
MEILLDKNKPFFKANLHCHSVYPDGKLTVEELKKAYMEKGYSIIAFTDHEHIIDNSHLTDENFLAITGCELAIREFPGVSTYKKYNMRVAHFNIYALDPHNTLTPCYSSVEDHFITEQAKPFVRFDEDIVREYSPKAINELIRAVKEKGFIVAYNHPTWSLENACDYLQYEGCFAVEIYNTGFIHEGGCEDEHAFHDMLFAGKKIYCTACDDNHNFHPLDAPECDSFGGCVYINAEKLDYDSVMQALQKGDFYASTGAQIYSLVREGNTVTVETSPCVKIDFLTRGRRKKSLHAKVGETLTTATFNLREQDEIFRIRIENEQGERAYSQAYDGTLMK